MMGWYPPLNVLSDSTWHMFTHVVESNQHSLHDIYVHGRLYPTHACIRCELILMHAYGCCRSLSWSLSSLLLAFTCTKREYCLCIQTPYESAIPSNMRYLPSVPSKFVCAKLQTFKWNSVLYTRAAHVPTRAVLILHVRWLFSRGVDSDPHSRENGWSPGCPVPWSKRSKQIKIIKTKLPQGCCMLEALVVSSKPWIDACGGRGV